MSTAILTACIQRLDELGISPALPIAWPGVNFNPPDEGMWLEAKLFPNEPTDPVWNADGCYNARGFFQVLVFYRPGVGQVQPSEIADLIIAHFPKASYLGPVRVLKTPWQSPSVTDGDKLFIPITIPYSGLVS